MTAENDIEALASKIAKEAISDDMSFAEKLDALKILTPYYTALKKQNGSKSSDDDNDGPSFSDFRNDLHKIVTQEQHNGVESGISSRRRT